ncbi:MAG: RNA recognition motif domain-containing protein [Syntrophobacteraceae bacterium]
MDIFVGNLSFQTTEQELENAFKPFGEVSYVKIITDHETSKSRGFAFVKMPVQEQANAAITSLNGKEMNGFILKVNEARPRGSGSGETQRGASSYPSSPRRENSWSPNQSNSYRLNDKSNDTDIYDTKGNQSNSGRGRKARRGRNDAGGRSGGSRWH